MLKFWTKQDTQSHPVPVSVPTPSPKTEEPVRLERIQEPGQQTIQSQYRGPYDAQGNYTGNPADLIPQSCGGNGGYTCDYGYVGTHNLPGGQVSTGTSVVVRK